MQVDFLFSMDAWPTTQVFIAAESFLVLGSADNACIVFLNWRPTDSQVPICLELAPYRFRGQYFFNWQLVDSNMFLMIRRFVWLDPPVRVFLNFGGGAGGTIRERDALSVKLSPPTNQKRVPTN